MTNFSTLFNLCTRKWFANSVNKRTPKNQILTVKFVIFFLENEYTNCSENRTEEDGKEDECCVPVMLIVDRVDAEEHENDGL